MFLFVLLLALLSSSPASGTSAFTAQAKIEYVTISGTILPNAAPILAQFQELESRDEIFVKIASTGGSVSAGYEITNKIQALQEQGKKVTCYVESGAYSAAFMIFLACSKRFAAKGSILMFHSPYLTLQRFTLENAESLIAQLKIDREAYLNTLIAGLVGADPVWVTKSFLNETEYPAEAFDKLVPGFLTITADFSPVKGYRVKGFP